MWWQNDIICWRDSLKKSLYDFLLKNKVSLNIVCFQMEKSLIQEMFSFCFQWSSKISRLYLSTHKHQYNTSDKCCNIECEIMLFFHPTLRPREILSVRGFFDRNKSPGPDLIDAGVKFFVCFNTNNIRLDPE